MKQKLYNNLAIANLKSNSTLAEVLIALEISNLPDLVDTFRGKYFQCF